MMSNSWVQFIPGAKLKDLHMEFHPPVITFEKNNFYRDFVPLRIRPMASGNCFAALQRLSFEKMNDHQFDSLSLYIASVLANAPKLEHLRLSVRERGCTDLFERICDWYQLRSGGDARLRLKSLSLGSTIHLASKARLGRLVDLPTLERARVGTDCECTNRTAAWRVFGPIHAQNLQQLQIRNMKPLNWFFLPTVLEGRNAFKVKRFRRVAGAHALSLSLDRLAGMARVPMLQVPFHRFMSRDIMLFFDGREKCEWLTQLKVCAVADICLTGSNGALRCYLGYLVDAMPVLSNLTALCLSTEGNTDLSSCHGETDVYKAANTLMRSCAKLEYVELQEVAYGAEWGEVPQGSLDKTWRRLSEDMKVLRQAKFFKEY